VVAPVAAVGAGSDEVPVTAAPTVVVAVGAPVVALDAEAEDVSVGAALVVVVAAVVSDEAVSPAGLLTDAFTLRRAAVSLTSAVEVSAVGSAVALGTLSVSRKPQALIAPVSRSAAAARTDSCRLHTIVTSKKRDAGHKSY
jgi:hypothetical protein